jgi:MoxR-like ATPase
MNTTQTVDIKTITHRIHTVQDYLNSVILGKAEVINQVLVALLSKGHLLIEDVPGVGKTTLAKSLADVLELQFQRISFTSDLMPSDILGVQIFNRNESRFVFQQGPIFTNILLADELNRTTPKTQSAFLEAMESGQVTIEKTTYPLPDPFMVMATQNPLEFTGTFPLPISQLDRFLMRIEMGYPDLASEEKMLVKYREYGGYRGGVRAASTDVEGQQPDALTELENRPEEDRPHTIPLTEVRSWQGLVRHIRMDASLVSYITRLAAKTREHGEIYLGVSPRASLALQRAAQAQALMSGRNYVIPDDIKEMVPFVWAHRVVLKNQVGIGTQTHHQSVKILTEILTEIPVPV